VCATDQFEQHIRAVCGWPLGDATRYAHAVMENLIGDDVLALPGRLGPDTRVEIYGKADARPGRKMAHITSIRAKNRSE
jgi:5-(carboxyamino)imidazole ribonucleotide synthase